MSNSHSEEVKVLFERWFVHPLKVLRSIPHGDGGFIALATACLLYERYATAVIKNSGERATPKRRIQQLILDFSIDERTARFFWDVIRNGILHQAMPKQSNHGNELPRWVFNGDFLRSVELCDDGGVGVLKVQPWLVSDRAIELCRNNANLLDDNKSFPWATII